MSEALNPRTAARLAAVLYVGCGLATAASLLLPSQAEMNRNGMLLVSGAAVVVGGVTWLLPWARWPRWTTLSLMVIALALISAETRLAGSAGDFRAGTLYVIAFAWLGLCHRRGTSLAFSPLLVIAYLAPLLSPRQSNTVLATTAYVVPVSVFLGEALSWLSTRMLSLEDRYQSLFAYHPDAIFALDLQGRIISVNPRAAAFIGRRADDLRGVPFVRLLTGSERDAAMNALSAAARGRSARLEAGLLAHTGQEALVDLTAVPFVVDGHVRGVQAMARDVTGESRLRRELRHQLSFNEAITNGLGEGVVATGPDGTVSFLNPAAEVMLGRRQGQLVGQPFHDAVHGSAAACVPQCPLADLGRSGLNRRVDDDQFLRQGGEKLPVSYTLSPVVEGGRVSGGVVTFRDVTERKAFEEQLSHRAFHDPLTNLANRALFTDRVEHAFARAQRDGRLRAVLFMDLDNFKNVNDSLGHAAGDELLVSVARRLEECLRPTDTAARLGGDEFAVLLEDLYEASDAARVAERVLAALDVPVNVRDEEVVVRASIGIAIGFQQVSKAEELLRDADVAMYMAKGHGKGRYEMFEPEMRDSVMHTLERENELRRALDRNEFTVHYQPIILLATGEIVATEALVRWRHPERGLVGPAEFIRTAEDTGLIVPMGRHVLLEACRQTREWQSQFMLDPPMAVSVNISARQFENDDLIADVRRALQASGLEPSSLILELTESALMADTEDNLTKLRELKSIGVKLAIDDFGTGYASLAYLRQFPVDILKIDKTFVAELATGKGRSTLARAVSQVSETLRLVTIAEGIESGDQARELRQMRCRLGQGYHYGHPVAPDLLGAMLARPVPMAARGA